MPNDHAQGVCIGRPEFAPPPPVFRHRGIVSIGKPEASSDRSEISRSPRENFRCLTRFLHVTTCAALTEVDSAFGLELRTAAYLLRSGRSEQTESWRSGVRWVTPGIGPVDDCIAVVHKDSGFAPRTPVRRQSIIAIRGGHMANVPMTQKDSIVDQLEQLHQRVARRAYDLFRGRDGWGDAFGDWLSAEKELVSKPAVELREQDGIFTVAAALPGVQPKDITVDITPQDVMIKAATERKHTEDKGQVHRCEFTSGQFFRSLPFPKTVDATKAKAEYQNGMLNITVPIAPEARAKRVEVTAA